MAALVAYRYLIPVVGFAPSTALFIFALSRFLENASWTRSLIFAVATAAASYYLFQVVLKIQMPMPMLRLVGWCLVFLCLVFGIENESREAADRLTALQAPNLNLEPSTPEP